MPQRRPSTQRSRRSSTHAPRLAPPATGPRRTDSATSSRLPGSRRGLARRPALATRPGRPPMADSRKPETRPTETAIGRSPIGPARAAAGDRAAGVRRATRARADPAARAVVRGVMAHAAAEARTGPPEEASARPLVCADPTALRPIAVRGSPTARVAPARRDDRRPGPPGPRHGQGQRQGYGRPSRPAASARVTARAPGKVRAVVRTPDDPVLPTMRPRDIPGTGQGPRPAGGSTRGRVARADRSRTARGSRRSEPLPGGPLRPAPFGPAGPPPGARPYGARPPGPRPYGPPTEPSAPNRPASGRSQAERSIPAGRTRAERRTIRAACARSGDRAHHRAPGPRVGPVLGRSSRPVRTFPSVRGPICSTPRWTSSSPVDGRSRRRSSPAARRAGCWSCRSDARRSRSSSSTPRACASRSSRSKEGR